MRLIRQYNDTAPARERRSRWMSRVLPKVFAQLNTDLFHENGNEDASHKVITITDDDVYKPTLEQLAEPAAAIGLQSSQPDV